jgi:hypothetical protein
MSALGHPTEAGEATPLHVRFTPKATVGDQTIIRRFVPKADIKPHQRRRSERCRF